ncbi:MAG TPA: phosphohistidine phosphatase SixA [bacterium]|nr:phosphohistidine phosphatase SixA [bacterium]
MALYLVQHGKALPQEQDADRPLSEEGRARVKDMAGAAAKSGIAVRRIEHSGKTRARQTAEIMAQALGPPEGVSERPGINPNDDVAPVAVGLRSGDGLMLVGHLPFMERLTSHLIIGAPEPPVIKFQMGGIVCLDQSDEGKWHIKWALLPEIG